MRTARLFLVLSLWFALPGLTDDTSHEQAIIELEARWSQMFGAGDIDGIMALMADNSVLIMPGSKPITGRDAIRAATQAMLASGDAVSWASDFVAVSPAGDMAYDHGTATTRTADGNVVTGHYLVVWIRENGQWRVAADMFN